MVRLLFFLLILGSGELSAESAVLQLKRILFLGEDVEDSYVNDIGIRGTLIMRFNDDYSIHELDFDVWAREELFFKDIVRTLSYKGRGAEYEVFSLLTNDIYLIYFIRRELSMNGYDPATIFIVTLEDNTRLLLDYRYPK